MSPGFYPPADAARAAPGVGLTSRVFGSRVWVNTLYLKVKNLNLVSGLAFEIQGVGLGDREGVSKPTLR